MASSIASSSRRDPMMTITPPRQPSTSTSYMTPPSRIVAARTLSSRSDSSHSNDKHRHWTPATQSIPLSIVDGKEGKGGMIGKSKIGDAERGLSSLFVENERKVGGEAKESGKKKKKGWGGSIVNGAMNATVFGAAIGLTAYRLWTGEEPLKSAIPLSPSTSMTTPSSIRSRPDSIEFPPPPAYTESILPHSHSQHTVPEDQLQNDSPSLVSPLGAREDEEDLWVDIRDPSSSTLSYLRSSRISPINQLRHSRHRSRGSRSSTRRLKGSERRVVNISIESIESPLRPSRQRFHDLFEPLHHETEYDQSHDTPSRVRLKDEGDDLGDEEDVESNEILHRLDSLGKALEVMIEDGKRALAAPCPRLANEGWITEGRSKISLSAPRRSTGRTALVTPTTSPTVSRTSGLGVSKGWKKVERRTTG